ncbi:MAG: hypothetical protein V4569_16285, partial [Pseudomonadota bacterium]
PEPEGCDAGVSMPPACEAMTRIELPATRHAAVTRRLDSRLVDIASAAVPAARGLMPESQPID